MHAFEIAEHDLVKGGVQYEKGKKVTLAYPYLYLKKRIKKKDIILLLNTRIKKSIRKQFKKRKRGFQAKMLSHSL